MGLIGWLFERNNPHPIGKINDRQKPKKGEPINWWLLIIGQIFFWGIVHIASKTSFFEGGIDWILIKSGFFILYLLIGYHLDIQPDYDNIGWLGGIFDHPFRYSDDINRHLIFFKIILSPGYIMAGSFVELKKVLYKN